MSRSFPYPEYRNPDDWRVRAMIEDKEAEEEIGPADYVKDSPPKWPTIKTTRQDYYEDHKEKR